MKKSVVLCAGLCAALALTGCKSSESAYKKAYLKAQAQQENQQAEVAQTETPVVAPIVEKPVAQTTVVDKTDNAAVSSAEGLQRCCRLFLSQGKCRRFAKHFETGWIRRTDSI